MDAFLERMSYRQFREWELFWRLEPWGGAHEDLRTGLIAHLLQWAHAGEKTTIRGPDEWFASTRPAAEEQAPAPDWGANAEKLMTAWSVKN